MVMIPMQCPRCSSRDHTAKATNTRAAEVTLRKRGSNACGHVWFTVEVPVSPAVVGWGRRVKGQSKPELRVPIEIAVGDGAV